MNDILLVEDSDDDVALIKRGLQHARIANRIVRASGGDQALQYLNAMEQEFEKTATPVTTVLLLDLKLPGFDGLDLLAKLQSRRAFEKTLRVVLSGLGDLGIIKKAYSLGAHSFLSKPVHQEELRELIQTYPEYWLTS